jgi:hypothetical protein
MSDIAHILGINVGGAGVDCASPFIRRGPDSHNAASEPLPDASKKKKMSRELAGILGKAGVVAAAELQSIVSVVLSLNDASEFVCVCVT